MSDSTTHSPTVSQQSESSFVLPQTELRDLLTQAPLDVPALTAHCMGNLDFGLKLLEEFQKDALDRVETIDREVMLGNLNAVGEMAHSLKGVAAILAANSLRDVSIALQSAAQEGDVSRLQNLVQQLRGEMRRLLDYIPLVRATAQQQ